jgi:SAM-dependent methyltransferase
MCQEILRGRQELWKQKPVLRAIYEDFYHRVIAACRPGRSLEIGGGSGNLKEYFSDVVSTDLVPSPWLDAAADAEALPFLGGSFVNLVAVDVLHHLEHPLKFLAEAERVLKPGGRLILLEPAITPVSWVVYRLFHPEPVKMAVDPLADGPSSAFRKPFDANQAIPTLLFGTYRARLQQMFPALRLIHFERLSFLAYPLSGGFRAWCLIPMTGVRALLKVERHLARFIGWLAAFRLFVVIEKTGEFPAAA